MCYVYVFTDGQYFKVGVSNDKRKRVASLQTGNPHKLEEVAYLLCNTREEALQTEAAIHKTLSNHRLVGEWFNCSRDAIEYTCRLHGNLYILIPDNVTVYGNGVPGGYCLFGNGKPFTGYVEQELPKITVESCGE